MTRRMKDKLYGAILGTSGSIIAGLVLLFFGWLRTDAKEYEQALKQKVDVIEFKEFTKQNEVDHIELRQYSDQNMKNLKDHIDTRFDDLFRYLDDKN